MSEPKRITLYAAVDSPYPHRVRLAIEEAKATYDTIVIDLLDKPEWYAQKVPYLVYGGSKLQPGGALSADAVGIPESLVILEFIADIFPNAHLLPADPTLRARARLFYSGLEAGPLGKGSVLGFLFQGTPLEDLLAGLDKFQSKLPPTGFAVGEWSIADAATLPVLLRLQLALKEGLGLRRPEDLKEAHAAIFEPESGPRFARLRQYIDDNLARPSVARSWDPAATKAKFEQRIKIVRAKDPTATSMPH
ncbi:uncharacterized protein TRAVEDRAFT_54345 [Trametes versicolor FP-101664 SS1]|uniref:GST N-terminal domain-containing protein n=1 Tax=Trametes versicolor (strain FP-101664) TaxID=717944 RepID=R7S6S5_TRAVS|nr:uncharacterized protein TRAVEDRAFT_54345 [Trametes versicolor FP-101664 SS1]EIW51591.1 hypothetical protein TRAVEDRAFT_54345 [Trametes versicolor FP-101664 SS1]